MAVLVKFQINPRSAVYTPTPSVHWGDVPTCTFPAPPKKEGKEAFVADLVADTSLGRITK